MTKPTLQVFPDIEALSDYAAERFEAVSLKSIAERGRFSVCLSGGSTPKVLYSKLAKSRSISWQQIHLFWGDERCVPPDSPESNFHMANETLIQKIPIPETNVHRMRGEMKNPAEAADLYEQELQQFFGTAVARFDLIYLGIGDDGHTASLFPGTPALAERQKWVVPNHAHGTPVPARLTLTLPVLNAAQRVHFLVSGKSKAAVLKRVAVQRNSSLPAALVQPDGELIFLADSAAASSETHH